MPGPGRGSPDGHAGLSADRLDDPGSREQIKKLIVYVEMDRCAADAVAHVTGARLGRRSLKFMDFGIMAASFLNLETGRAFRVVSTEESRELASLYAPEIPEKYPRQLEAYKRMPDNVLFRIQKARIEINEADLPGRTRSTVTCARCGQVVRDHREVMVDGSPLCAHCAGRSYFRDAREICLGSLEASSFDSSRQRSQPNGALPVGRNDIIH